MAFLAQSACLFRIDLPRSDPAEHRCPPGLVDDRRRRRPGCRTGLNNTGLNNTGLNNTGLNNTGLNDTGPRGMSWRHPLPCQRSLHRRWLHRWPWPRHRFQGRRNWRWCRGGARRRGQDWFDNLLRRWRLMLCLVYRFRRRPRLDRRLRSLLRFLRPLKYHFDRRLVGSRGLRRPRHQHRQQPERECVEQHGREPEPNVMVLPR
jgi:hypothetical protein